MTVRDKTAPKAGKVLIINSDPEITRILEVNLIHANLEVLVAHNSAEAFQITRRDKADTVLLDQDLLDTESPEIFQKLLELFYSIPIIVIGTRVKKLDADSNLEEIAINYIAKPFDPREVVAIIKGYLTHKETTYTVMVTKKNRNDVPNIASLQLAMDINRKEAREALKNIQRIISSLLKTVPQTLKDSFDRLSDEIQEMAILCNRSLYLAADFHSRLDILQDRLSQQESEQVTTAEAILTICRTITRSMQVRFFFDMESGKRVARYSLAIAKEMKMTEIERQALYHAALLKDLALAFSRAEVIEDLALISREAATALKEKLNLLWKALATIPFLLPACNLLLYKHERYDGTGGSFGLKGNDIPLGSRILAVADAYDRLTAPRSPVDKKSPDIAIQQVVIESRLSFDPHVISALLMFLKRNEMDLAFGEIKGEIDRGVVSG
jgi:response regulator RpfG family c-di-GMP phosphodiesterase